MNQPENIESGNNIVDLIARFFESQALHNIALLVGAFVLYQNFRYFRKDVIGRERREDPKSFYDLFSKSIEYLHSGLPSHRSAGVDILKSLEETIAIQEIQKWIISDTLLEFMDNMNRGLSRENAMYNSLEPAYRLAKRVIEENNFKDLQHRLQNSTDFVIDVHDTRRNNQLNANYADVAGKKKTSKVFYNGMPIGEIKRISLDNFHSTAYPTDKGGASTGSTTKGHKSAVDAVIAVGILHEALLDPPYPDCLRVSGMDDISQTPEDSEDKVTR